MDTLSKLLIHRLIGCKNIYYIFIWIVYIHIISCHILYVSIVLIKLLVCMTLICVHLFFGCFLHFIFWLVLCTSMMVSVGYKLIFCVIVIKTVRNNGKLELMLTKIPYWYCSKHCIYFINVVYCIISISMQAEVGTIIPLGISRDKLYQYQIPVLLYLVYSSDTWKFQNNSKNFFLKNQCNKILKIFFRFRRE